MLNGRNHFAIKVRVLVLVLVLVLLPQFFFRKNLKSQGGLNKQQQYTTPTLYNGRAVAYHLEGTQKPRERFKEREKNRGGERKTERRRRRSTTTTKEGYCPPEISGSLEIEREKKPSVLER